MAKKPFLRRLKASVDPVDVLFGIVPASLGYAAFVSWANVIVRAVRGEEAKENWKTFMSTAMFIGVWALMSGARVREMASLRGAAVEMRGLAHEAAAQSEIRDRQAAERDRHASRLQAHMLSLTKWLVALAGLTLAAAIVALMVSIAQ